MVMLEEIGRRVAKGWEKTGVCSVCGSSRFSLEGKEYPCGTCIVEKERREMTKKMQEKAPSSRFNAKRSWQEYLANTEGQQTCVAKLQEYVRSCSKGKKEGNKQPWILLRGTTGSGKSLLISLVAEGLKQIGLPVIETTTYQMYEEFKWWRTHGGMSIWGKMEKQAGILLHEIGHTNISGKDEHHFWHEVGDYLYRKGKIYGGASGEEAEKVARYIEPSRLYQRSERGKYVITTGKTNYRYNVT